MRAHFETAKAVSKHMRSNGGGVIMTLSTPGSQMTFPGGLGFAVTCAAIEAFSRALAGEARAEPFLASDRAGAISASIVNLSCGALPD